MRIFKLALASSAALLAGITSLSAQTAVGLVGDNTLVTIDTAKPAVTKSVKVTGAGRLLGIDLRPADQKLYGVTADGMLVSIDPSSGEAKNVSKLEKTIPEGVTAIVDFNPAADKLRFMGSDGTNLRVDPASGKVTTDGSLAYEKSDMNAGKKPNIVAAAYSNSFGKPEKTAMYDIDANIGALIQQVSPNDGTLKAIGKLGIDEAKTYALDIATTADGANTAWLVADNTLYTVDLATGMAKSAGKLTVEGGTIRDITALPAM